MDSMRFLLALSLVFFIFKGFAQEKVPFDTLNWEISGEKFQLTSYKGQEALFLENASALLRDAEMENGVIEWDMAFPKQRGFTGLRFRMEDGRNFEDFYFRPHQSGNPDANQYCPVDNGLATWQLYHGEAYSVPYDYHFEEWFHVKLVVSGTRAELYIDNMDSPALHIPFLKRKPMAGPMMVYASIVPTYFANFSFTPSDHLILVNAPRADAAMDPLTIPNWSVSNPFPESLLEGIYTLVDLPAKEWKWQELPAESSGTANLGTISDFQLRERNTVFVKVILESETEQIKGLQIGFSDRVRVFCNGQLLFSGNDGFRTRDYRYLGTIGYFDTVYLPLMKGKNEIQIAVSESFGGWGIRGKLEDWEGIRMVE